MQCDEEKLVVGGSPDVDYYPIHIFPGKDITLKPIPFGMIIGLYFHCKEIRRRPFQLSFFRVISCVYHITQTKL